MSKEEKSKNINVKDAEPVIAELESLEAVEAYTKDDTRDGITDAVEKRLAELEEAEANAETVTTLEVDYVFLKEAHEALTKKLAADKHRRGLSQPNADEKRLIEVKEKLDELLK